MVPKQSEALQGKGAFRTTPRWFLAWCGLFFAFALVLAEWEHLPDDRLHLTMLDVGQGEALLIETPGNQKVLIDGGPDLSVLERLGKEISFFRRRIDLLILTHADEDHVTGLPEVLKRYDVRNILLTGAAGGTSWYESFLDEAGKSGARIIIADADHDLDLGEGMILDILWPLHSIFGDEAGKTNNASIVAKLLWKDHSILLAGDIEEAVETALWKEGYDLHADVLKVPHHGSKTSSSTGFLLAVHPRLALVSVGRGNRYGHPHAEVVRRYESMGIPIRSTSQEGSMEIVFD